MSIEGESNFLGKSYKKVILSKQIWAVAKLILYSLPSFY